MLEFEENLKTMQLRGHLTPQTGVRILVSLQSLEGELNKFSENGFQNLHFALVVLIRLATELEVFLPPLLIDDEIIAIVVSELHEEECEPDILKETLLGALVISVTRVSNEGLILIIRGLSSSSAPVSHVLD